MESHFDYQDICKSLQMVKQGVDGMNNTSLAADITNNFCSIQNSFGNSFVLLEPSRQFIREGDVTLSWINQNKKVNGHLFLFNDLLLLSRKSMLGQGYTLDEQIPLVNVVLADFDAMSFQINGRYVVTVKTYEERLSWEVDIMEQVEQIQKREGQIAAAQMKKQNKQFKMPIVEQPQLITPAKRRSSV